MRNILTDEEKYIEFTKNYKGCKLWKRGPGSYFLGCDRTKRLLVLYICPIDDLPLTVPEGKEAAARWRHYFDIR